MDFLSSFLSYLIPSISIWKKKKLYQLELQFLDCICKQNRVGANSRSEYFHFQQELLQRFSREVSSSFFLSVSTKSIMKRFL